MKHKVVKKRCKTPVSKNMNKNIVIVTTLIAVKFIKKISARMTALIPMLIKLKQNNATEHSFSNTFKNNINLKTLHSKKY